MKMTKKLTLLLGLCAALACAGAPAVAEASAISQSILDIQDFTITLLAGAATVNTATNTGDVLSILNGAVLADSDSGAGNINLNVCQGAGCGAYAVPTELIPPPTSTFVNSTAILSGNAIIPPGADALTDNTVSLLTGGDGTAQSNLGLTANFTASVGTGGAELLFSFLANPYLLDFIAADQTGTAQSSINWSLVISDSDSGTPVFEWNPNGVLGTSITGGVELADCFTINTTRARNTPGTTIYDPLCAGTGSEFGNFAASVALGPGTFDISIRHLGAADATTEQVVVPQPAALGLTGIGLLVASFWFHRSRGRRS